MSEAAVIASSTATISPITSQSCLSVVARDHVVEDPRGQDREHELERRRRAPASATARRASSSGTAAGTA